MGAARTNAKRVSSGFLLIAAAQNNNKQQQKQKCAAALENDHSYDESLVHA